jgi:hypothetical protein
MLEPAAASPAEDDWRKESFEAGCEMFDRAAAAVAQPGIGGIKEGPCCPRSLIIYPDDSNAGQLNTVLNRRQGPFCLGAFSTQQSAVSQIEQLAIGKWQ